MTTKTNTNAYPGDVVIFNKNIYDDDYGRVIDYRLFSKNAIGLILVITELPSLPDINAYYTILDHDDNAHAIKHSQFVSNTSLLKADRYVDQS